MRNIGDIGRKLGHLAQKETPERLKIVCSMIRPDKSPINVLDVGCGEGGLGMLLKKRYGSKVNIIGIDISEEALKLAEPFYDKLLQVDVENEDIRKILKGQKFDYIVAIEILEHLFKPELLVSKLKGILKPDGYIIVSFPNFAFWKYRIECLLGRFPDQHLYSDAEHIHYWSFLQFIKFLNDCRLDVIEFDGVFGIPFSRFLPRKVVKWLGKKFPNVFGYQIVLKTTIRFKNEHLHVC